MPLAESFTLSNIPSFFALGQGIRKQLQNAWPMPNLRPY